MKRFCYIFIFIGLFLVSSCHSRVVSASKPMYDNNLELYQKYIVQTKDAKEQKIQVLKVDSEKIYGKNKNGTDITINRSDVREIKKFELLPSLGLGAAAILALILIPV